MANIKYTVTSFVEPLPLSQAQYNDLKVKIENDPSFKISPNESFTDHFSGMFIQLGIGFGGGFLLVMIGGPFDGSPLLAIFMLPAMILIVGSFILLFKFFSEAPSYARYAMKSRNYFEKMKVAISQSESYYDFYKIFYK
jgi:hypothetical protein